MVGGKKGISNPGASLTCFGSNFKISATFNIFEIFENVKHLKN